MTNENNVESNQYLKCIIPMSMSLSLSHGQRQGHGRGHGHGHGRMDMDMDIFSAIVVSQIYLNRYVQISSMLKDLQNLHI